MTIPATVKAIGRAGAGTNNIPVAAMSDRGVPVFNAPGANANAVRELVLAALLIGAQSGSGAAVCRRAAARCDRLRGARRGRQEAIRRHRTAAPHAGDHRSGRDRRAGGGHRAEARHEGGRIRPGNHGRCRVALQSAVRKAQTIDEVLKQADFVTLHVPLLAATRGLIDAKRLAMMKPGAVLLNFARDAIVDEAAVVEALRADRLKAYLTDFPSPRCPACAV